MDSDDKKVKIDQFYLNKIVFDTIRGDKFLYISLEFDYRHNSCCYNVFLSILRSLFFRAFFLFYTIFFLSSLPSRVDQITSVDPCPISTFLKSLRVAIRLKIIVQVHFLINAARELATEHSMQWQQLSLRYFMASLYLVLS